MFRVATTIVLGAGASWGYGYPLGDDLIDKVINFGAHLVKHKNKRMDDQDRLLLRLNQTIRFYDPISVDNFLWHYREDKALIDQAKKLIAEIVVSSGEERYFLRGAKYVGKDPRVDTAETNWYRFLWDALVSEQTTEEISDPSKPFGFNIITFNYDASLEYFLYTRVTSEGSMFTEIQQEAVLEKLKSSIHHVYGCLLNYKWMGGTEENNLLKVAGPDNRSAIKAREIYENILLINERSEADYAQLQNIITESAQVIFLGFGFDDTNIGRSILSLEETLKPRKAASNLIHQWLPVIKYTNYGDSLIINEKINSIIDTNEVRMVKNGQIRNIIKDERSIFKSTEKVYQALENDFTLNNI